MRAKATDPEPVSYLARLGFSFDQPDEATGSLAAVAPGAGADGPSPVASPTWPGRVRRFTAQHAKVLSVIALAAVIVATWMVMQARTVPLAAPSQTPAWTVPPVPATSAPPWLVHVVGAVAHPGVVSVPAGARVIDAIQAAGGFTQDADPANLNLAAMLVDGCQIVIGTRDQPQGELRQGANGDAQAGGTSSSGGAGTTINLNQATEAELDTLPGVGPVTAQAILTWREKNGPFTAITQLQEVDGIGPKTYAQIEPYVSI